MLHVRQYASKPIDTLLRNCFLEVHGQKEIARYGENFFSCRAIQTTGKDGCQSAYSGRLRWNIQIKMDAAIRLFFAEQKNGGHAFGHSFHTAAFIFKPIGQRRKRLSVRNQGFEFFFARHAGEVIYDLLKFGRYGHVFLQGHSIAVPLP